MVLNKRLNLIQECGVMYQAKILHRDNLWFGVKNKITKIQNEILENFNLLNQKEAALFPDMIKINDNTTLNIPQMTLSRRYS